MAENSEHNGNGEGWAFHTGEDNWITDSGVAAGASPEPISQQSTAEPGGRRSSPRGRINPFLARQYSDDVSHGLPATQPEAPSTPPETPSAQPEAPSAQPETPSAQPETPSTQPEAPSTQPEAPSTQLETSSAQPETSSAQPEAPSTQPEAPSAQSEAPSTQQLASGDHHIMPSTDTATVVPASQYSTIPVGSDLVPSNPNPMISASSEARGVTSPTLARQADSDRLCSVTEAAGDDPSDTSITSDFIGLHSPGVAASTTSSVSISASTSTAVTTSTAVNTATTSNLSTDTDPSPPLDPYTSRSPVTSDPFPDNPPSPAAAGLASPSSPSSAAHFLSAPSSDPHHLSILQHDPSGAAGWPAGPASSGDEDWERRPPAERWAPLGANDADDEGDDGDFCLADRRSSLGSADPSRLRKLEEEQEHLNNSLMALTTHFAQVQFRLRQIVEAPTEEKEQLLQELETFAFRGIPDVRQYKLSEDDEEELTNEWKHQELVETQRVKQRDLMQQLKTQLEDLEHYAYETGEAGLPSSVVLEKQRVIIDELKGKLNIDLNNLDRMTAEDLKSLVDCAVGQLINPLKMKEQLVTQLKTQVQDLERFISFLQGETEEGACDGSCRLGGGGGVGGAASTSGDDSGAAGDAAGHRPRLRRRSSRHHKTGKHQDVREETSSMMKRALTLLQLMTLTQFGCGAHSHRFSSNELKKTPRGNHWGDLRARLELGVSAVSELARESLREQQDVSDHGTDESDAAGPPAAAGDRLTLAVRRELAMALRDLIQHGLLQLSKSRSVVPFAGCLPSRQSAPRLLHAWDLVLVYYRLKRGVQYNATPQRRLSQSFGLSVVGGTAITSKHTLLSAIGNIISTHTPLKRSADAHFKAFVCAGLNARKLSSWLRLILTTQAITEEYYQPWSYVVSTGFDDALQCVARLEKMRFALPEDLAVRQLRSIRDAF